MEGPGMDNSWVMLRKDANEWILVAVLLFVATIGVYVLLHPGAMGSVVSDFIAIARNNARFR